MKFNIETISSVKKRLNIEIPAEDVSKALDGAYLELKKKSKIKGFRPGKTPRPVLEQMYSKNVHKDITSQMIQDGLSEVLKDNKINFAGCKDIDPPDLKLKEPYLFSVEIYVKPEIEHIDFKGLKLIRTLYDVSDQEVEVQLKMLQNNLAKKRSIGNNRPVKKGDFINISYEGLKNGIPFKDVGKIDNFNMKVGALTINKALDDGVIGMNLEDEKEILVRFPEDYHDKKIAALEIFFKVKIKDIMEEDLPEINDAMAKQLGPFKTLKELKNKIFDNLKGGYEKRKEQELNEQIFTQLIDKTSFDLPEILVEQELEAIINEVEKSFEYYNKSIEKSGLTRDSLVEKYEELAKKQVRRQLILGKIIEQEKLNVSEDVIDKEFEKISSSYNSPLENIKNFYIQNPDKLKTFKYALLEKQAMDVIINNNTIEEIKPKSIKNQDS